MGTKRLRGFILLVTCLAISIVSVSGNTNNQTTPTNSSVQQEVSTQSIADEGSSPSTNSTTICDLLAKQAVKPATTTKKPECLPFFQCVNGECTAGMSCKCHEGWAGIFCQKPCPNDCGQWGVCMTGAAGNPTCACNMTSMYVPGSGCVDKDDLNLTTSTIAPITTPANLRKHVERECFAGFLCVYGYCQHASLTCVCDRGWRGDTCNQPCEIDCNKHGYCKEDDHGMMFCECDRDYTGEFCEISIYGDISSNNTTPSSQQAQQTAGAISDSNFGEWLHTNRPVEATTTTTAETTTTTEAMTTTTTPETTTMINTTANVTEVYMPTLRPIDERTCFPGFECVHGYCPKDSDVVHCICDVGWGGPFCETPVDPVEQNDNTTTARPTTAGVLEDWSELDGIPLAPLAQRLCYSNFICRYGNCSSAKIGCDCEQDFTGTFCESACPLECGPNARCEITDESGVHCACLPGFTGVNCSEIFQLPLRDALDEKWWAVGASIGGVIVLAIIAGIVFYVLWRKQNITAMKIVKWFQSYEDDDGRDYDAFVSYASADKDRHFVIQHLVPRLEGRLCFSLCIHQRNFMAGVYITDGITESIKKSRRTLLVISPAFIESTWCKFEYQVALHEMIAQKNRIVPIFIGDPEDLKKKMDHSLKSIMNSVTYLEYPGEDASEKSLDLFWKRLALSMPKKKVSDSSETSSGSTSSNLLDQSSKTLPNKHLSDPMFSDPPTKTGPIIKVPFRTEDGKEIEFKQIVRVPAIELDPPDYDNVKEMGCLAKFFHGSDAMSSLGSDLDFVTSLPTRVNNGGHGLNNVAFEPDRNGYGPSSLQQNNNTQHPGLMDGYSPSKGKQYRSSASDNDVFLNMSDNNYHGDQSLQHSA